MTFLRAFLIALAIFFQGLQRKWPKEETDNGEYAKDSLVDKSPVVLGDTTEANLSTDNSPVATQTQGVISEIWTVSSGIKTETTDAASDSAFSTRKVKTSTLESICAQFTQITPGLDGPLQTAAIQTDTPSCLQEIHCITAILKSADGESIWDSRGNLSDYPYFDTLDESLLTLTTEILTKEDKAPILEILHAENEEKVLLNTSVWSKEDKCRTLFCSLVQAKSPGSAGLMACELTSFTVTQENDTDVSLPYDEIGEGSFDKETSNQTEPPSRIDRFVCTVDVKLFGRAFMKCLKKCWCSVLKSKDSSAFISEFWDLRSRQTASLEEGSGDETPFDDLLEYLRDEYQEDFSKCMSNKFFSGCLDVEESIRDERELELEHPAFGEGKDQETTVMGASTETSTEAAVLAETKDTISVSLPPVPSKITSTAMQDMSEATLFGTTDVYEVPSTQMALPLIVEPAPTTVLPSSVKPPVTQMPPTPWMSFITSDSDPESDSVGSTKTLQASRYQPVTTRMPSTIHQSESSIDSSFIETTIGSYPQSPLQPDTATSHFSLFPNMTKETSAAPNDTALAGILQEKLIATTMSAPESAFTESYDGLFTSVMGDLTGTLPDSILVDSTTDKTMSIVTEATERYPKMTVPFQEESVNISETLPWVTDIPTVSETVSEISFGKVFQTPEISTVPLESSVTNTEATTSSYTRYTSSAEMPVATKSTVLVTTPEMSQSEETAGFVSTSSAEASPEITVELTFDGMTTDHFTATVSPSGHVSEALRKWSAETVSTEETPKTVDIKSSGASILATDTSISAISSSVSASTLLTSTYAVTLTKAADRQDRVFEQPSAELEHSRVDTTPSDMLFEPSENVSIMATIEPKPSYSSVSSQIEILTELPETKAETSSLPVDAPESVGWTSTGSTSESTEQITVTMSTPESKTASATPLPPLTKPIAAMLKPPEVDVKTSTVTMAPVSDMLPAATTGTTAAQEVIENILVEVSEKPETAKVSETSETVMLTSTLTDASKSETGTSDTLTSSQAQFLSESEHDIDQQWTGTEHVTKGKDRTSSVMLETTKSTTMTETVPDVEPVSETVSESPLEIASQSPAEKLTSAVSGTPISPEMQVVTATVSEVPKKTEIETSSWPSSDRTATGLSFTSVARTSGSVMGLTVDETAAQFSTSAEEATPSMATFKLPVDKQDTTIVSVHVATSLTEMTTTVKPVTDAHTVQAQSGERQDRGIDQYPTTVQTAETSVIVIDSTVGSTVTSTQSSPETSIDRIESPVTSHVEGSLLPTVSRIPESESATEAGQFTAPTFPSQTLRLGPLLEFMQSSTKSMGGQQSTVQSDTTESTLASDTPSAPEGLMEMVTNFSMHSLEGTTPEVIALQSPLTTIISHDSAAESTTSQSPHSTLLTVERPGRVLEEFSTVSHTSIKPFVSEVDQRPFKVHTESTSLLHHNDSKLAFEDCCITTWVSQQHCIWECLESFECPFDSKEDLYCPFPVTFRNCPWVFKRPDTCDNDGDCEDPNQLCCNDGCHKQCVKGMQSLPDL